PTTTSSASASRPPTVRKGFRFPLRSVSEAVPHAPDREDELRSARIALELLAQVAHVDVDRPRVAELGAAPERLEQHPAAVDAPRVARKPPEQLELDVGELHLPAFDLDRPSREIDAEPVDLDRLGLGALRLVARRPGAAEERAGAGTELPDRERLRHIVVGAE